jgi:hypothetical protein
MLSEGGLTPKPLLAVRVYNQDFKERLLPFDETNIRRHKGIFQIFNIFLTLSRAFLVEMHDMSDEMHKTQLSLL